MSAVRELCTEAWEILNNIRNCPELTWQQRDELMQLVATDVKEKLTLAREMLYYWTGVDMSGDKPTAA